MKHDPTVISLAQAIAAQHGGQMMLPIRDGLKVMGQSDDPRAAARRLERGSLPFPTRRLGDGRQHYVDAVTLARIILGDDAQPAENAEQQPQPRRRGPGRPRKTTTVDAGEVGHA